MNCYFTSWPDGSMACTVAASDIDAYVELDLERDPRDAFTVRTKSSVQIIWKKEGDGFGEAGWTWTGEWERVTWPPLWIVYPRMYANPEEEEDGE